MLRSSHKKFAVASAEKELGALKNGQKQGFRDVEPSALNGASLTKRRGGMGGSKAERGRRTEQRAAALGFADVAAIPAALRQHEEAAECSISEVRAVDMTPALFLRYLLAGRPAVIRGGCDGWPFMKEWTQKLLTTNGILSPKIRIGDIPYGGSLFGRGGGRNGSVASIGSSLVRGTDHNEVSSTAASLCAILNGCFCFLSG